MTISDGIHENIPFDVYREIDAVNVSLLKELVKSPGHLRYAQTHPKEVTPAMIFGAAVDCLVCEGGDAFQTQYTVRPEGLDLRTRVGKDWKAQHGDKAEVPQAAIDCAGEVLAHEKAREIIDTSRKQVTLVWTDEQTGVRCKGRPDFVSSAAADDLKTSGVDISIEEFARIALKFRYHWQLCHYMNGLRTLGEPKSKGRFIVAEQAPPHRVEIYEFDADWYTYGNLELAQALEAYAYCEKQNHWPTSTGLVQMLPMPTWGRR